MDQLRADAFLAPFRAALATGVLPGTTPTALAHHRGAAPQIQVTVPASVLLGISEAPGHLFGYGPVTADVARAVATEGTWRRILTDPASGAVLDVGATTYRPPAALARYIQTRDQTCRFPGCNWPAAACEFDHTTPYPRGPTTAANGAQLCSRHHHFKHDNNAAPDVTMRVSGLPGRERLRQEGHGFLRWTMPTGHTITVGPPAVAAPLREEVPTSGGGRALRRRAPTAGWPHEVGTATGGDGRSVTEFHIRRYTF
jgi:hypothetical protein